MTVTRKTEEKWSGLFSKENVLPSVVSILYFISGNYSQNKQFTKFTKCKIIEIEHQLVKSTILITLKASWYKT